MEVEDREDEEDIVAELIRGLCSGLTYGGAETIKELQRKLDYARDTAGTRIENQPHRKHPNEGVFKTTKDFLLTWSVCLIESCISIRPQLK